MVYTVKTEAREEKKNVCMYTQIHVRFITRSQCSRGCGSWEVPPSAISNPGKSAVWFSELEGSRSKRRSLSQLSRQAGRQGAFLLIQSLRGFHEHPPRHTHTHTSSRAFCFTPSTVHRLQCSSHLETASQTHSEMTFNQDTLCPS